MTDNMSRLGRPELVLNNCPVRAHWLADLFHRCLYVRVSLFRGAVPEVKPTFTRRILKTGWWIYLMLDIPDGEPERAEYWTALEGLADQVMGELSSAAAPIWNCSECSAPLTAPGVCVDCAKELEREREEVWVMHQEECTALVAYLETLDPVEHPFARPLKEWGAALYYLSETPPPSSTDDGEMDHYLYLEREVPWRDQAFIDWLGALELAPDAPPDLVSALDRLMATVTGQA